MIRGSVYLFVFPLVFIDFFLINKNTKSCVCVFVIQNKKFKLPFLV